MKRSVTINPKYEYLREFIEAIPMNFDSYGNIMQDRRNTVKSVIAGDTHLNIKKFARPKHINKIIYSIGLRNPKGLRAYCNSFILRDIGIDTPEAVAYIEDRKYGIITDSFFISIQVPFKNDFLQLCYQENDTSHAAALALGALTARFHKNKLYHKDYSQNNLLYEYKDGKIHFCVVDINRLYNGEISMKKGCHNFDRMYAPTDFLRTTAREYARHMNYSPDECEKQILHNVSKNMKDK